MKRIWMTMIAIIAVTTVFGQNNKVVEAYNHHRYGKLDKAKIAIDAATQHEKTMGEAKTWFYRGNIYYDIAISADSNFNNLDPDPLSVAWESYKRATELDDKGQYKEDITRFTMAVGEGFYNEGVLNYNEKDYKGAAMAFEKAFLVNESVGKTDTTALYNAAIAASFAEDDAYSKELFNKVIDMGYSKPDIYASLSEIYKKEGDTVLALNTIKDGRVLFPEDFNLLIAETNIYLATNEKDLAMKDLEQALQFDKTNPTIFFAVATIYDQIGDKEKAEESYKQSLELNPEYFEANYNLGALYVNQAADILTKANDLPLDAVKEYEAAKTKADELLAKSLPYLEKALELNPEDVNTLISLKEIYTRLGEMEKLKIVDEKLK